MRYRLPESIIYCVCDRDRLSRQTKVRKRRSRGMPVAEEEIMDENESETASIHHEDEAPSTDETDDDVVVVKQATPAVHTMRGKPSSGPTNTLEANNHPKASPISRDLRDFTGTFIEIFSADKRSELFCLGLLQIWKETDAPI